MGNSYNSMPVVIDTDMTVGWRASQTLQAQPGSGFRVTKIELVAASATSAGTVTIVDPVDNTVLYPPIGVAAALAAGTSVVNNDLPNASLAFRDFKATGLTATATKLYIWYRA